MCRVSTRSAAWPGFQAPAIGEPCRTCRANNRYRVRPTTCSRYRGHLPVLPHQTGVTGLHHDLTDDLCPLAKPAKGIGDYTVRMGVSVKGGQAAGEDCPLKDTAAQRLDLLLVLLQEFILVRTLEPNRVCYHDQIYASLLQGFRSKTPVAPAVDATIKSFTPSRARSAMISMHREVFPGPGFSNSQPVFSFCASMQPSFQPNRMIIPESLHKVNPLGSGTGKY